MRSGPMKCVKCGEVWSHEVKYNEMGRGLMKWDGDSCNEEESYKLR